jgi:hypothetical protein
LFVLGIDGKTRQSILKHVNIAVTENIYTRWFLKYPKRAMAKSRKLSLKLKAARKGQAPAKHPVITTARPLYALYQRIAAKALHLRQLGLEPLTIARRLSTTDQTVVKALIWLAR